ncbi:hypothetical protein ACFFNY_32980 [Paenibacillus hodogayensis]|uniref:LPXTG cell wall anchor domain-containing protein n=1 Tax=Paenibacillus hodogayensis TaxID=279208 RepID=A0ABV5W768_9BACL
MNGLSHFIGTHWRSMLLLLGLAVAVWYMLKHKKKFENNEFE